MCGRKSNLLLHARSVVATGHVSIPCA